jgi:hypothetical protein
VFPDVSVPLGLLESVLRVGSALHADLTQLLPAPHLAQALGVLQAAWDLRETRRLPNAPISISKGAASLATAFVKAHARKAVHLTAAPSGSLSQQMAAYFEAQCPQAAGACPVVPALKSWVGYRGLVVCGPPSWVSLVVVVVAAWDFALAFGDVQMRSCGSSCGPV